MPKPQNLDKLLRKMRAIPERQRLAAAAALKASAEEMAAKVRSAAPRSGRSKRPKAWPKAMADRIFARPVTASDSRAKSREGKELAQTRAAAGLGWKVTAPPPAMWVEFGTKGSAGRGDDVLYKKQKGKLRSRTLVEKKAHAATPAQPFFWPTVRAQKKRLIARVKRESRKGAVDAVKGMT